MSLTLTIVMLISMWLSIAAAMLWGVLRVLRRHAQQATLPDAGPAAAPQAPRRRPTRAVRRMGRTAVAH